MIYDSDAKTIVWSFSRHRGVIFCRDRQSGFFENPTKPNILFIVIDDQNDWVGPLKGHPLTKTPQLDRLAARGTTFTNAHCQAPICHPSRTSFMLGLRPTTTGIYGMSPWFRTIERWKDRATLPQ